MTKKYLLTSICVLFITILFIGCDDDDDVISYPSHPSHRDGVYEGEKLSVTLDGDEVYTVTSVTVKSNLLNANVNPDNDSDTPVGMNPTYNSTITVNGFPTLGMITTFETVSDLQGFKGTTTYDKFNYRYVGEFTGDPLTTHDKQGLILQFYTE